MRDITLKDKAESAMKMRPMAPLHLAWPVDSVLLVVLERVRRVRVGNVPVPVSSCSSDS